MLSMEREAQPINCKTLDASSVVSLQFDKRNLLLPFGKKNLKMSVLLTALISTAIMVATSAWRPQQDGTTTAYQRKSTWNLAHNSQKLTFVNLSLGYIEMMREENAEYFPEIAGMYDNIAVRCGL